MNTLQTCVLLFVTIVGASAKIPDSVKFCKRNDPECFHKRIEELLPQLADGIPEMAIPPVDPLVIPRFYVDSGKGGNFAFDINVTNVNFIGARKMVIEKATIDHDKKELEFRFRFPVMNVTGPYTSTGKILVIPINGEGEMYITFYDVVLHGIWTGEVFNKKGKEHYKFTKKEFEIINKKGEGHFGNLIKGNPTLTDSTNKVFNDNFDAAFEEFKPSVDYALEIITTNCITNVFDNFSVDVLFPK